MSEAPHSRRAFLTSMAATVTSAIIARPLHAASLDSRVLQFHHTHTSEHLAIEYFRSGSYVDGALRTVNHFLRDFRTGDVHAIDTGLLDLLHALTVSTGTAAPFQVISGYRSPVTNAALRQHSEGVAAGSLHMTGQAIDIRLADVPLVRLHQTALTLRRGGVGFYPSSDFVHVDTGRVRAW